MSREEWRPALDVRGPANEAIQWTRARADDQSDYPTVKGGKDMHRRVERMRECTHRDARLFLPLVPWVHDAVRTRTTSFATKGSARPRHCRDVRTA